MRFLVAAGVSVLLSFLCLKSWSALVWTVPDRPPSTDFSFRDWQRWWSFATLPVFEIAECRARLARASSPRIAHWIPEDVERAWNFRSRLAWHDHLLCSLEREPMITPSRGALAIRLTYLSSRWAPFVIDLARRPPSPRGGLKMTGGSSHGGGMVFLDEAGLSTITDRLDQIGFWDLRTDDPSPRPISPTEFWLIEATNDERYHAVLRPRGRELAPVIDAVFEATAESAGMLFPTGSEIEDARKLWR